MRAVVLTLSVILLYLLHQDFWFWRDGTLVFGAVPIGLFYHAVYTVATSLALILLVRLLWPAGLDAVESPDRHDA